MQKIKYKGREIYSPKTDLMFKAVFGQEESKEILRSFLNSMLKLEIEKAEDISLENTELIAQIAEGKSSRLDVRVATANNEHIDIEIQIANSKNIANRSLFYVSKLLTEQLKVGENPKDLGRAIGLNILDFNYFEDNRWFRTGRVLDVETGEEISDRLELNFVELKKIPDLDSLQDLSGQGKYQKGKNQKTIATQERNLEEKNPQESLELKKMLWLEFLKAETEEELMLVAEKDREVYEALQKLDEASADAKMRYILDMRDKTERDNTAFLNIAREEGIAEGEKRGLEHGRAETIAKLLASGMKEEDIAHALDIPVLEVHEIGLKYQK